MRQIVFQQLRSLATPWLASIAILFTAFSLAGADDGVPWRFSCLAITCAGLVAWTFRHDIHDRRLEHSDTSEQLWKQRMTAVSITMIATVLLFSVFCLLFKDQIYLVSVAKAVYVAMLAICIVPYFALTVRKVFGSVVLAIMAVFSMKLLGCLVVVCVYGWDASERGYTTTPWTHPNLLVWLFLLGTTVLSLSLLHLGKKRFYRIYERPSMTAPV